MHLCIIFKVYFAINTDGGLFENWFLFGEDLLDFGDLSPPRHESTSSDSYMMSRPNTVNDELAVIFTSTSAMPGLLQNSEDVAIDLGKLNAKKISLY